MVWGQVGHQGSFPYPEAQKIYLLDAITTAGEVHDGEYRKVHLIRNEDGKQTDKMINVDRMVKKGVKEDNVLLKPDDIVWVPLRHVTQTPTLNDVFSPLLLLGYIGIRPFGL